MAGPRVAVAACLLVACSGSHREGDDAARNKLAADVVACRTELAEAREKAAEALAELRKLREASLVEVAPVDLAAAGNGGAPPRRMEGNIAPERIGTVVRSNASGLRACYERALKRNPNLQVVSTVTLGFHVRNTGRAFGVTLKPRYDAELDRCVAGAVERWRFPEFEGEPVEVETPVNLVAR